MDEGFAFKYQKGGKVEQKRMYTMPLKPGSRKTASGFKRGGAIKDAVSIARRMCRG
jgi:hypothetical protein